MEIFFLFVSLQVHSVIYFQTGSLASMPESCTAAGESSRIFISSLGAPLFCQVEKNWRRRGAGNGDGSSLQNKQPVHHIQPNPPAVSLSLVLG